MVWAILALTALALIYLLIIRPILKSQPAFSAAFAAEASFIDKLRAKLTGFRTYIAAAVTGISGVLVAMYDQVLPLVLGQNWEPLTSKFPSWALPVFIVAVSAGFAFLRKISENPPVVITQKDAGGVPKVVDVVAPPKA